MDAGARPFLVVDYLPATTCPGSFTAYGAGRAGAGGLVPLLAGSGCAQVGAAISLDISQGVGGAAGALFAGLQRGAAPFKGGTFLVDALVLQVSVVLGGAAGEPGAGSLSIPAQLPVDPALQGVALFLQAAFQDGGAPVGVALSGGLAVLIG